MMVGSLTGPGEQSETLHPPLEEITYRKALRLALEILSLNTKHSCPTYETVAQHTVTQRKNKGSLCPASDVIGSGTTPLKKCVKKGSNADGCIKHRQSPRLSNICIKARDRPKDLALSKVEKNETSKGVSGPVRGVTPRTSKPRTPQLKTEKRMKDASAGTGLSTASLQKGKKIKLGRNFLKDCIGVATTPNSRQENTPVSGFRHSMPSIAIRNVSYSKQNAVQQWGDPCKETKQCTSKPKQALAKAPKSASVYDAKCKSRTSLLTSNQGIAERRCKKCPNSLSSANSKCKSAKASNHALSHTSCKATRFKLPDFEMDEKEEMSELSMELSSSEFQNQDSSWMDGEEEDEDEDLPSVLQHQEPCSIESGMLVWCKYYKYPYWPGVMHIDVALYEFSMCYKRTP